MASTKQNKEFIELIFPESYPLDIAVEYISKNLRPEDVFSESELESWAESNDYEKK